MKKIVVFYKIEGEDMEPWLFPVGVLVGYAGLVLGLSLFNRWRADQERDKRVSEWVHMIREKQSQRSDAINQWPNRMWKNNKK